MRQIRELLRLTYECGLSHARIARALGLSKGVVGKYVKLAARAGLS
jgi:DNA-binding transcriptional regulator LsrR (DeoR family)